MNGSLHGYLLEGDSGVEDWDRHPTKCDLGDMFTNFGNKLSQDMLSIMELNRVFPRTGS